MPELPEVETIVRDLRGRIPGHTVTRTEVVHRDVLAPDLSPARLDEAVRGRTIDAVDRRAKNILVRFDNDDLLLVNLGMTGRLIVSEAAAAAGLRHIAVRFELDDGHALLYDDIRRFGRIELHSPESWREREAALGPEPLADAFTADDLHARLQQSRTAVRNWLLDQRRIAGVGNIYASEALFRAGIRPDRPARSLDILDAAALHSALRDVLSEAIEARGTTLSDYRDARGEFGSFGPALRAYGREGEPCPMCDAPIERTVISNRSAFFCPACQQ